MGFGLGLGALGGVLGIFLASLIARKRKR